MSFKAKDLSFDSSQPTFLRRLRGELTSGDSARHEQPIQRNKRMKQDDEDDGPTYILEDTKESLTKEEYQALVAGKDSDNKDEDTPQVAANQDSENIAKSKDKISEVGAATKKRKVAKIIGEETTENGEKDAKKTDEKPAKKPKKKTKAIKLSFGDE